MKNNGYWYKPKLIDTVGDTFSRSSFKSRNKKTFTKSIGHRYKSKLGDRVGEAARICNATLPLRGLASGGREAEARICGLYCIF